jgi:ferredoxin
MDDCGSKTRCPFCPEILCETGQCETCRVKIDAVFAQNQMLSSMTGLLPKGGA